MMEGIYEVIIDYVNGDYKSIYVTRNERERLNALLFKNLIVDHVKFLMVESSNENKHLINISQIQHIEIE